MKPQERKFKLLILSMPAIIGLALLLYLNISGADYITLFPCPLFERYGIACPFCGGTRSVCSILTFRFWDAIKYNLAVFILFFLIAGVYIYCIYKVIRFNKFIKINLLAAILAFVVFPAAFAVIRNFPFYPWPSTSPYSIIYCNLFLIFS